MVDQLKIGLVMTEAVERGIRALPREAFLPGTELDRVYSGMVVPTKWDAGGMAISASSEVGVMAVMADQPTRAEGARVLRNRPGRRFESAPASADVGGGWRGNTDGVYPPLPPG